jgi:hypothetical protein
MRSAPVGAAILLVLAGCGSGPQPITSSVPSFDFTRAPTSSDAVDCHRLLEDRDIQAVVAHRPSFMGKQGSSCYWQTAEGLMQLVFNTGPPVAGWREALRETYAKDLRSPASGVEIWRASRSESVAALGPDRGVIVHGVTSANEAATLALLALSRL